MLPTQIILTRLKRFDLKLIKPNHSAIWNNLTWWFMNLDEIIWCLNVASYNSAKKSIYWLVSLKVLGSLIPAGLPPAPEPPFPFSLPLVAPHQYTSPQLGFFEPPQSPWCSVPPAASLTQDSAPHGRVPRKNFKFWHWKAEWSGVRTGHLSF